MDLAETLAQIRRIMSQPDATPGPYHPPGSAGRIADGTVKR